MYVGIIHVLLHRLDWGVGNQISSTGSYLRRPFFIRSKTSFFQS